MRKFLISQALLAPTLILAMNACGRADDSGLSVDPVAKSSSSSASSSASSSSSKAKSAVEAAMRRDIQLKKDELSLRRQDMNKANASLESVKEKIAKAELDAASTVPQSTGVNVSNTNAAIGSAVEAKRAEDAAAAKKSQLYALADKLKVQQAKLEAKIAELEEMTSKLEEDVIEMTKQLNDIARGKVSYKDVP